MMKNKNEILKLLKELTSCVAVSGAEDNMVELLKNKLSACGEVSVDSMNNVFCTFGKGRHFLLDAHIDEIGMTVTEITDDGFVKVAKCGGIDNRILLANEVSIWGKKEIYGVISTMSPHFQKADDEKTVPDIKDISIDTGLDSDELKKLVSPGDRVTLKRNFTELLNGRVSASCLDNRSGAAALLLCIDELQKLPCKVTLMFSSQEEVGTRGAKIGPYAKKVDEAVSVDVSFALSPGCDESDCKELSSGPMIGFSPILDKEMSRTLVSVAEKENIPYQREIMSGVTGTNADVISVSESGIKTALISIPQRYMHQSVETVDTADVQNTARLICAYIAERVGDKNA